VGSKREQVLQLAERILSMKQELARLEVELDRLLGEHVSTTQAAGNTTSAKPPEQNLPPFPPRVRFRPPPGLRPLVATASPATAEFEESQQARVVAHLEKHPELVFDALNLSQFLSMKLDVMRTVLSRLSKAGKIVRVRKGLYRALKPGEIVPPQEDEGEGDE
jgi:hypothetical protein